MLAQAAAEGAPLPLLGPIGLPELLLGLLHEPECRAARILADARVELDAVVIEWLDLVPLEADELRRIGPRRWSAEVREAMAAAAARLADYPQPLELATEHLLLGIVLTDGQTGRWLRGKGLDPAQLEAEIHRLNGHQTGPLEVDWGAVVYAGPTVAVEIQGAPAVPIAVAASSSQPIGVLRIIDAAANRAGEGLRAVEDYVSFVLDDRHLTELAKQLRHDLAAALARVPAADRHSARETTADVGAQRSARRPNRGGSMLHRLPPPRFSALSRRYAVSKNMSNSGTRRPRRCSSRCDIARTPSSGPSRRLPTASTVSPLPGYACCWTGAIRRNRSVGWPKRSSPPALICCNCATSGPTNRSTIGSF